MVDHRPGPLVCVLLTLCVPALGWTQGAAVSGGVTDAAAGANLAGVAVRVGDSLRAVTDAKGSFQLRAVPPGKYDVHLSLDGYRSKALRMEIARSDRQLYVTAALMPLSLAADSTAIRGDTTSVVAYGRYVGFYRRRHAGLGYFFTQRDIERLDPGHVTDLLRPIPGALFNFDRRGQVFVSFHLGGGGVEGCVPAIYLDGARAGRFMSLDELVHPGRIEGMEVYTGLSLKPLDFPEPCVIAVWTR